MANTGLSQVCIVLTWSLLCPTALILQRVQNNPEVSRECSYNKVLFLEVIYRGDVWNSKSCRPALVKSCAAYSDLQFRALIVLFSGLLSEIDSPHRPADLAFGAKKA